MDNVDEAHLLLQKILAEGGYSFTHARRAVFDILWGQEPLSMKELEDKGAGKVDRVSIYRNITLFEKLGIVQRIMLGWKYKLELSDVFTHHHHHLSCLGCGSIQSVKDSTVIDDYFRDLEITHKVKITRHQLEIQGYCAKCQEKLSHDPNTQPTHANNE